MGIIDTYSKNQEVVETTLDAKVNPMQLEWEPLKNKERMQFDQSLERLRDAGYTRHPRPHEVFSLLCDHFEGKLHGECKSLAQRFQMFVNPGIWLSMALERKGNSLVCYTDPENLRWNTHKERYVIDGPSLKCSNEEAFEIPYFPISEFIPAKEFSPEFNKMVYSRELSALPERMRKVCFMSLPEENLWPVGCSHGYYGLDLYYYGWVSCGVCTVRGEPQAKK